MPVNLRDIATASLADARAVSSTGISAAAATGSPARPSAAAAARFRAGIGQLVSGVTVVTSADDGAWYGATTTSVCPLGADPPSLIACVPRRSAIGQHLGRTRSFCVNLLSRDQRPVAEAFAAPDADGFAHGQWDPGATGAPVLGGSLASFECDVDLMYGYCAHVVIIGSVLHVRRAPGRAFPLATVADQFCQVTPAAP